MGSLLLVYGCLVFLVAETELPLALDSVLEEQSLPPQHSLSPSFPDSKQGEAMQSAANRQTGKESPGVHGSHAPLADADHTSHSAHSVPSPSSHSRNQVLRFLSAVNLRARVAKKKKIPFVLEESVMDSKERAGNCRAEAGEQYTRHLGTPTSPSPKNGAQYLKKKRKRFLASWPLQATILPSEAGRWVRVCTCKRRPSIPGVSDTQGSSNS